MNTVLSIRFTLQRMCTAATGFLRRNGQKRGNDKRNDSSFLTRVPIFAAVLNSVVPGNAHAQTVRLKASLPGACQPGASQAGASQAGRQTNTQTEWLNDWGCKQPKGNWPKNGRNSGPRHTSRLVRAKCNMQPTQEWGVVTTREYSRSWSLLHWPNHPVFNCFLKD